MPGREIACRRSDAPFWLWPNLLSLDAPRVALVWQDFLARCYRSVLLPAGRAALFLTVWGIYIADRLIDATGPESENEVARRRFYRKHGGLARILLWRSGFCCYCADRNAGGGGPQRAATAGPYR